MITSKPITLSQIPARIMLLIGRSPVAKATALEGVATGNIKAQLTAKVTTMVIKKGSIPSPTAIEPIMGKKAAAVAVLLVSSVNRIMTIAVMARIKIGGRPDSPETLSPTQALKPVAVN